jgi:hypothetical protein
MNTDTPRTDAQYENNTSDYQRRLVSEDLEQKLAASQAEVERLRDALKSCFWATNTYDGNYTRACDNVAMIVTKALKAQDNK